jgi:hypothetical protein
MNAKLVAATALLALIAVPAFADNGQIMRDPQAPYRSDSRAQASKQCFNGKYISGVSRSGETSLYVQARTGAIYELSLSQDCATAGSVQKVTLRADGDDVVCAGADAELIARTSAGVQQCHVTQVRRVAPGEAATLR